MKTLLLTTFLSLCYFGVFSQNTWSEIADFGGGEREKAVAFAMGNRGYVGTGIDSANTLKDDFWEYDPGTNSWTQKANVPGGGRRDAIGFAIGNRGYIGTGINGFIAWAGTKRKDFYEYNPITNTWTDKDDFEGNFGGGIYYASGFAVNDKGYLVCGKLGPSYYSNELWEYNPATDDWVKKSNIPGGTRYGVTAFAVNGKGYVGCGADENYFLNTFYEYDPATDDWTEKAPFPGSPRFNAIGFAIGERGFIGFGTDGGYQKDLYEYNPATDSWMTKASLPASERRSCVVFVIDGAAYAGTGKAADGVKRGMFKYKPFFLFADENDDEKLAATVTPNPIMSTALFTVKNQDAEKMELKVFDLQGKMVSVQQQQNTNSVLFNRGNLIAGVYLYEITLMNNGNADVITGKLFIQ